MRMRMRWQDRAGSTAVEFALILPAMALFILGLFEFGRLFWTQNMLQFAVEEAARAWMADNAAQPTGSTPTSCSGVAGTVPGYISAKLIGLDPSDIDLSYTAFVANIGAAADTQTDFCQIIATYNYNFIGGLGQWIGLTGDFTLYGKAVVPM
jgi:Flp pilus assembly protein TadG